MDDIMKAYDEMANQQQSAFKQQNEFVNKNVPSADNDPFVQAMNAGNFQQVVDGQISGGTPPKVDPHQANMERIKKYESYSNVPYDDGSGNMTGGYGHKLLPGVDYSQYTEQDWNDQFVKDYTAKSKEIENYFGSDWANIDKEAQNVLTDLAFNMGTSGLTSEFPQFISDIKLGNYADAAENLKYVNPGQPETSDWWDTIGGDKYYENNWANPMENRGNYSYQTLKNIGNKTP